MKKFIALLPGLVFALFLSLNVLAQTKPEISISGVKRDGKTINFSLTSSQPFIVASNTYVLYIGKTEVIMQQQTDENGKGHMTFFIPQDEYKLLKDGDAMYLTYGQVDVATQDMDELSRASRRCWSLGKFSSGLLSK